MGSFALLVFLLGLANGALFPRDSQTRQTKSLDGIWNFRLANSLDPEQGFTENW
jgi:beta-glucuronidase